MLVMVRDCSKVSVAGFGLRLLALRFRFNVTMQSQKLQLLLRNNRLHNRISM